MKRYKNNKPIFPKSTNPNVQTSQSTYSNTGESMIGGIMSSVIQGAALGSGSHLASRGIDAIMGPRKIETVVSTSNCLKEQDAYISCMHKGDTEQCKNIFEMLSKCKNINI